MAGGEALLAQLDEEIRRAEHTLAFWTGQVKLQENTQFAEPVRVIAANANASLEQLRSARRMIAGT